MTSARQRRRAKPGAHRGAALLLVLWLVALLTALVGAFALAARTEHLQGQVLSRGVVAQQAARAGIEYAITRLRQPDPRWRWLAHGPSYPRAFPQPPAQHTSRAAHGQAEPNTTHAHQP